MEKTGIKIADLIKTFSNKLLLLQRSNIMANMIDLDII